jgi:predicted nucleic acid-binding protein
MTDYYVDSSVLVKRHVREMGTEWFRALVNSNAGNLMITSRISMVEVYSALSRRRRESVLTIEDYGQLAADFTSICLAEYQLVELTDVVVEQARALFSRHPLRAYDAVQLASALLTQETLLDAGLPPLVFLTADARLLSAAQAEGLTIDTPKAHI